MDHSRVFISTRLSRTLLIAPMVALLGFVFQPIEPAQAANAAEIASLTDLYNDLGGPGWTTSTNWLVGDPCTNGWYGIVCDASNNVIEVQLNSNNLTGNIQDVDLSGLTYVEQINLNGNLIGGSIDGLILSGIGLTNLRYFYLGSNQIGGSIDSLDLTGLSNLYSLVLANNLIGGDIGSWNLSGMGLTTLHTVWLYNNQIGGDIGNLNLSNLPSLSWFSVDVNQIGGDPSGITGIPASLRTLQLGSNQMNGTIPDLTGASITVVSLCANPAINPSGIPAVDTLGETTDTTGWTAASGCGITGLVTSAACNSSGNLEVTITTGDGPFNITGSSGLDLPQNGVHIGVTTLTGPGSWTGVTVTELTGDTESSSLGDYTCTAAPAPEMDVQRPAGSSIADGGNDPVGTQPVGATSLTYTIENTGSAPLDITFTGINNWVNVSGFLFTIPPPASIPGGASAVMQIDFNIDASGPFSFDLVFLNNDADENPYDIYVQGTGTSNLAATAACNGNDLDVTITAGDGPFDITGTGASLPLNGIGIATHTLTGPDSWTGITITETAGDTESANLGNYTCPPPVVVGGVSSGGGGGSASGCNLVIDVEADHEVVAPGDRVMWTVRVTNSGSAECQSVQTYGTMPDEFSITDIEASRGNLNWDGGQYYRVELGTLAVNEQVTVSIDSLLQGVAALTLPEGAAGQSAGTQICLTGYITDPVNDTDCVTLFPDTLPSTGGEPVSQSQNWGWGAAAGILIIGLGGYAIRRRTA